MDSYKPFRCWWTIFSKHLLQKYWKMTETLANGYSSESTPQELSNEYQHDSVWIVFQDFCILISWTNVASALKGLKI